MYEGVVGKNSVFQGNLCLPGSRTPVPLHIFRCAVKLTCSQLIFISVKSDNFFQFNQCGDFFYRFSLISRTPQLQTSYFPTYRAENRMYMYVQLFWRVVLFPLYILNRT